MTERCISFCSNVSSICPSAAFFLSSVPGSLLDLLLFFIHRPVGMPKMEKVYLHNPSSEQISLISISATTAHFHASFFQNRVSTHHFVNTDFYWNRKFIMETQSCRACPLPRLCVELNQTVCILCVMSHLKQWVRRVGTIQTLMKKHCVFCS